MEKCKSKNAIKQKSKLLELTKLVNPTWVITKNDRTFSEFRFIEVKIKDNPKGGYKQYTIHRSVTEDAHYIECKTYKNTFCKNYDLFQRKESIYTTTKAFENAIKRIEKLELETFKSI